MSRVTSALGPNREGEVPADHVSVGTRPFGGRRLEGAAISAEGGLQSAGSPAARKRAPAKEPVSAQADLKAALTRIHELETELAERSLAEDSAMLSTRLEQLERDLGVYRDAKRSAELAVLDIRSVWKHAEQRITKLRESPTYRLGQLMMAGFSSWRDGVRLPVRIAGWYRDYRQSLLAPEDLVPQGAAPEYLHIAEIAIAKADKEGLEAAERWVQDQRLRGSVQSRVLLDLAKHARAAEPAAAVSLAKAAVEADPNEGRVKLLAFTLMDTGSIEEAGAILRDALRAGATLNATEARRYDELMALERFKSQGVRLPRPLRRTARATGFTVLLYAPQSLPYHWSSTSMRTHALAQELARQGCSVRVVTQPGYPARSAGAARKSGPDRVDGIAYHRLAPLETAPAIIDQYSREAGKVLGRMARTLEADFILAAGELESAYPAAIASRIAGAGLVLDCLRLTPADTASSEREDLLRRADDALMAEADLVLARWPGAAEALEARGIPQAKLLTLGENAPAFAADDKAPAWRSDPALSGRVVIGYVGDPHEDIDLEGLGDAFDALVKRGASVALAVFGVGSRFLKLQERLNHAGHGERILFPGRPKVGAIAAAYAAIDIVVAPTLAGAPAPLRSRFELVDALMHGKIVVASEGPVARAVLGGGAAWTDTGRESLAETLAQLANDAPRRTDLQARTARRAEEWRALAAAGSLADRLRTLGAARSS